MDPIIIAFPIYWLAFKLLIAASGPGVGGIKVWEVYNPPDKENRKNGLTPSSAYQDWLVDQEGRHEEVEYH